MKRTGMMLLCAIMASAMHQSSYANIWNNQVMRTAENVNDVLRNGTAVLSSPVVRYGALSVAVSVSALSYLAQPQDLMTYAYNAYDVYQEAYSMNYAYDPIYYVRQEYDSVHGYCETALDSILSLVQQCTQWIVKQGRNAKHT